MRIFGENTRLIKYPIISIKFSNIPVSINAAKILILYSAMLPISADQAFQMTKGSSAQGGGRHCCLLREIFEASLSLGPGILGLMADVGEGNLP
jgi:hypothetical protein